MESISRLSSILETARDLTLEAAQSASSSRGIRIPPLISPAKPASTAQIKKLLDSRNERDVLEGLRNVISLSYQPNIPDSVANSFFSSVVKTITSHSLPIRKFVYIYLVLHAESNPDLALLSINAIQRSLTDKNPVVRAVALRVMSGIRVPVISQIVVLAIKKGSVDMSAVVRRTAALAIPKCYRLEPGSLEALTECLSSLLGDKEASVAGAAVMAYVDICPERLELIHPIFRNLMARLADVDEWGQIAILTLMVNYGRRCFPLRTNTNVTSDKKQGFYDDEETADGLYPLSSAERRPDDIDPDHLLLLTTVRPLLQSRNAAVVLAVVRLYRYLLPAFPVRVPQDDLSLAVVAGPLVSLLRSEASIHESVFPNIIGICIYSPQIFVRYVRHFLLRSTDPPFTIRAKIELLTLIFPHCSTQMRSVILSELEHFAHNPPHDDQSLIRDCIRGIGRCAQPTTHLPDPVNAKTSQRILRLLLRQTTPTTSPSPTSETLISESLTVIRHLIQTDPTGHRHTVTHLARHLDRTAQHPEARASVIWLVGEFASLPAESESEQLGIAPDVLRILLRTFPDETVVVKLQILLLAARVYLLHLNRQHAHTHLPVNNDADYTTTTDDKGSMIPKMWAHVLLLVRYDTSYDLRDRARLYRALLPAPSTTTVAPATTELANTQLATLLLLAPKPAPRLTSPSEGREGIIGSVELVLGENLGDRWSVPDWVKDGDEPDPRLRDTKIGVEGTTKEISASERLQIGQAAGSQGIRAGDSSLSTSAGKGKTLDDWLAESETDGTDVDRNEGENDESEEEVTDSDEDEEEESSESEGEKGRLVA